MEHEELIRRYFEHRLSVEEQALFESLMENDVEFAQEVAYQKNVKKAITLNEREALKKTLQSFEPAKKQHKKLNSYWYIAAAVILFFSGLTWFQLLYKSPEKLYQDYYHSYPNVVAPTVRGEHSNSLSSVAFYEYDSGNYKKALELFTKIYTEESVDYALFYQAMSLMELKRYDEAIVSFEQFETADNNAFTPYVKWYQALSHLKINQKEKAISLLKDLASTENPQQQMAQQLLAELE